MTKFKTVDGNAKLVFSGVFFFFLQFICNRECDFLYSRSSSITMLPFMMIRDRVGLLCSNPKHQQWISANRYGFLARASREDLTNFMLWLENDCPITICTGQWRTTAQFWYVNNIVIVGRRTEQSALPCIQIL